MTKSLRNTAVGKYATKMTSFEEDVPHLLTIGSLKYLLKWQIPESFKSLSPTLQTVCQKMPNMNWVPSDPPSHKDE